MIERAEVVETEHGLRPRGPGWYVLNATEAAWVHTDRFGRSCTFEGDVPFPELGLNVHVLLPGEPACQYHRENQQEDFLVLSGECLVVVEGQEQRLKAWDFVHCPAGTTHVFVGAGSGPCVILMAGARRADERITYPVCPAARAHGACVEQETDEPRVAYAGLRRWTAPLGFALPDPGAPRPSPSGGAPAAG